MIFVKHENALKRQAESEVGKAQPMQAKKLQKRFPRALFSVLIALITPRKPSQALSSVHAFMKNRKIELARGNLA
jgi:hypothetical protein